MLAEERACKQAREGVWERNGGQTDRQTEMDRESVGGKGWADRDGQREREWEGKGGQTEMDRERERERVGGKGWADRDGQREREWEGKGGQTEMDRERERERVGGKGWADRDGQREREWEGKGGQTEMDREREWEGKGGQTEMDRERVGGKGWADRDGQREREWEGKGGQTEMDRERERESFNYEGCCWLVSQRPSNRLVCLRDESAQTTVRAETRREKKNSDQICYLTQPQCAATGPTSPSADSITPDAWQGSHWRTNVLSHCCDSDLEKAPPRKRRPKPGSTNYVIRLTHCL